MRTLATAVTLLGAVLLLAPGALAGEPLYPQGTGWQFVQLELREVAKGQKLATGKLDGQADGSVGFGLDDVDLALDGLPGVEGGWTRKSPASRKLELLPGEAAQDAWLARAVEQLTALAEQQGVPEPAVALAWSKTSWRASLKAKASTGEAQVKLAVRLKAGGTLHGADGSVRKVRWSARLRGASVAQPLSVLHVGPGTSGQAPQASFLVGATSGPAPFGTQFLDTSTGAVTSLAWDFGDGAVSQEPSPLHTFSLPGEYTVRLTASGPQGSDTAELPITVQGSGPQSLVLFPGLVANLLDPEDLAPILLPQQGPHQLWYTGFTGGLERVFPFVYPSASNESRHYAFELALGTNIVYGEYVTQVAEVSLRVVRDGGGAETLVGPVEFVVSGEVGELPTVFFSTDDGPPLGAQAGDRLELVIRNASPPEIGSTHALEVLLSPSRVEAPGV